MGKQRMKHGRLEHLDNLALLFPMRWLCFLKISLEYLGSYCMDIEKSIVRANCRWAANDDSLHPTYEAQSSLLQHGDFIKSHVVTAPN
jgi:hypothetical protein